LTSKGLFLLDLKDLAKPLTESAISSRPAKTHTTVGDQTACAQPDVQLSQKFRHVLEQGSFHVCRDVATVDDENKMTNDVMMSMMFMRVKIPFCRILTEKPRSAAQIGPNIPNQCPEVFKSCEVMALSTLAKRLQKVQQPVEETPPDFSQFSLVTGSAGNNQNQLRQDTPGQVVQSHVDSGATLGALVHSTFQQEPQTRTSALSALREPQGGALRSHRSAHADDERIEPTGHRTTSCNRARPRLKWPHGPR
jgi:hypothetical protein